MKYIWEPTDIKPTDDSQMSLLGSVVCHKNRSGEHFILGYTFDTEGQRYVRISLNDGLITSRLTPEEMARELNMAEYIPLVDHLWLGPKLSKGRIA